MTTQAPAPAPRIYALAWAVVIVAATPLLLGHPAALQDWPNHLARVHIMIGLQRGDPFSQHYYIFNPHLVPNAALDATIGLFMRAGLSLDRAAQVFLVATYGLFVGGFCAAAFTWRSYDPTKPLLASLLFYSGTLAYGLVNYVAGLATMFWLLALWQRRERPAGRFAAAVAGVIAAFYVHLVAAAAFVLVIGCLDVCAIVQTRAWSRRTVLKHLSSGAAACALAALLLASPREHESLLSQSGAHLDYASAGNLLHVAVWKTELFAKQAMDGIPLIPSLGILLALAAAASLAAAGASLRLDRATAAAIAACFVMVLAAPEGVGTGRLMDYRLALVPLLLGACLIVTRWRNTRLRAAAVTVLALAVLVRTQAEARVFLRANDITRAFASAERHLPSGSLLMIALGRPHEQIPRSVWWSAPIEYLATMAVADGKFVPAVFAFAAQQPVVLRQEYETLRGVGLADSAAGLQALIARAAPICHAPANAVSHAAYAVVVYPGAYAAVLPAVADGPGFGFWIFASSSKDKTGGPAPPQTPAFLRFADRECILQT